MVLPASVGVCGRGATEDRTTGVSTGDWFKYASFVSSASTNDPNATFQPPGMQALREFNETAWMLLSIKNVSSTTVSLETTTHFENGTEVLDSGYVNVYTGSGNMLFKIIAANLNINDSVYAMVHSEDKISNITDRMYPSGVRLAVYIMKEKKMNVTRLNSVTLNGNYDENVTHGWDRTTGILVEYSFHANEAMSAYTSNWSYSYELTDSNLWDVPEYPTWIPVMTIITVLTLFTLIVKRESYLSRILK